MPKQKTSSAHYHDYKPPYLKWWEDNFWSDMYVRRMTPTARHFYRALLQAAFFCDTRPFLPGDDEQLWMIADAENMQEWLKQKDQVLAKFIRFTENGKELLRNKRLDEEWAALLDNLEHSKNAGLASARARADKANTRSTPVEQPLNASQRPLKTAQPTETVTCTEPLTSPVTGTQSSTSSVTETVTGNGKTVQHSADSSLADENSTEDQNQKQLRALMFIYTNLATQANNIDAALGDNANDEDIRILLQSHGFEEVSFRIIWVFKFSNYWNTSLTGTLHFRNSYAKISQQMAKFDLDSVRKVHEHWVATFNEEIATRNSYGFDETPLVDNLGNSTGFKVTAVEDDEDFG